ncbi:MAG: folate-binding protein YgfZ, partial [Chroococcidiopsidaceae cyanobacterium CP_BM_RX_35]|nr:folate-binding protein YgfZ [Chroococcidiopsidaceae cyanobacterium CP_BM_RX_35]
MMSQELHDLQATYPGAKFEAVAQFSVPVSFGNDSAALVAAQTGVAVCDRSHWGLIQVSSEDRIRFLHNQSTNDFQCRLPGEGCDTVMVTSTARTIDLVTAYITEDTVLLLVSPNRRQYLMEWLDRFIFYADKVLLKDISTENATFNLIGPESDTVLQRLGAEVMKSQSYGNHKLLQLQDIEVRVAVGSGLAIPGYTLIVPASSAMKLWNNIIQAGAVPLGDHIWEQLRIQQGRPAPERELTEDYNPLEAGLWQAISFDKGCYIGQETIARLNTYQGVKQQLWGISLSAPAQPGSTMTVGDEKVGLLTSYTNTAQGYLG